MVFLRRFRNYLLKEHQELKVGIKITKNCVWTEKSKVLNIKLFEALMRQGRIRGLWMDLEPLITSLLPGLGRVKILSGDPKY